jgi:hypothetical protein
MTMDRMEISRVGGHVLHTLVEAPVFLFSELKAGLDALPECTHVVTSH